MSRCDGTEPPLIDDLFVTSDRRRIRQCMRAPPRTCISVTKKAPALGPSSDSSIAILIKAAITYRLFTTYDAHRAEPAAIQLFTISGDILHDGVWRPSDKETDADGEDGYEASMKRMSAKASEKKPCKGKERGKGKGSKEIAENNKQTQTRYWKKANIRKTKIIDESIILILMALTCCSHRLKWRVESL